MTRTKTSSPTPQDILGHNCYDCIQRYAHAKLSNPSAIALVRLGDFYEAYDKDADTLANALELVLTSKGTGSPKVGRVKLTGIPYYALDRHVKRLQAQGHQVVVVEKNTKVTATKLKDTFPVAALGEMKLIGNNGIKALVYRQASRVLGIEIKNTKQLKKYFPGYDFRRKQSWIDLAIALWNRLAKTANGAGKDSASIKVA